MFGDANRKHGKTDWGEKRMDYITVRQAAQEWGISERLVQKYCAQGRIEGAMKFGSSWGVPAGASKPEDPRKEKGGMVPSVHQPVSVSGLMPLMNTAFKPGHCRETVCGMPEGPCKEIAWAEYYYFSGHPEQAEQRAKLYLNSPDPAIRLSACLIYAYANLSIGQIQQARFGLSELKKSFAEAPELLPQMQAAGAFILSAAAVLLHLPLPEELPSIRDYLPLLPAGLRAFALYVQAHRAYLQKDYEKSLGIVEATLAMQDNVYPIPSIYLHLVAVMDYMSLRQVEQAQFHLLAAWKLAQPDDLIEGFGEHHGLLGGMLEAVIKKDWPEDFKRIIAITYRFSAGWRKIHNPSTGHDVADNLTTTEFAAAMLAARGWTNQEIGEHMNISPNTVKRHISMALQKLNIRHRQDLKKYMLL